MGSRKSSRINARSHYCKFNKTKSAYGLTHLPRILIPTVVWHYLVSDVHTGLAVNGINACSCGCDETSVKVAMHLVILQLFGAHCFFLVQGEQVGRHAGKVKRHLL